MLFDTKSNYYVDGVVGEPDKMTFFGDVRLSNKNIMNEYNSLITQGRYDDANAYVKEMSQSEDIYLYSADFFNLIENRIEALQKCLLDKKKIKHFIYSDNEPANAQVDSIWL